MIDPATGTLIAALAASAGGVLITIITNRNKASTATVDRQYDEFKELKKDFKELREKHDECLRDRSELRARLDMMNTYGIPNKPAKPDQQP